MPQRQKYSTLVSDSKENGDIVPGDLKILLVNSKGVGAWHAKKYKIRKNPIPPRHVTYEGKEQRHIQI